MLEMKVKDEEIWHVLGESAEKAGAISITLDVIALISEQFFYHLTNGRLVIYDSNNQRRCRHMPPTSIRPIEYIVRCHICQIIYFEGMQYRS
jgi:hypothetical protein